MMNLDQDFDSPWKDILEAYFREFMAFFFPWIEEDIDWEKEHEFLDKEFQSIVKEAEIGRRYDDRPSWRPDRFGYEVWGCEVSLRFPVAKILDYIKEEEKLLESNNPFALVVISHIKAMETRNDPEARTRWKLNLVKRLYQKGYTKKDVIQLFSFMDWVMHLPEELSKQFWEEVVSFEEAHNMPYVTSVERIGIEKGIQQGIQQGMLLNAQEMLIEALSERFGVVSSDLTEQIKSIDSREVLKALLRQALRVKSLDEFQDVLKRAK